MSSGFSVNLHSRILAETVELMAAAVGEGIVNVEDVLTVLGSQGGDDHFHAFFFIADDAVHIGLMVIAVDGDDRDLPGRFTELADIGFGRKWRADSDDCIDVLIGHSGNIFAVMPCIAAGIESMTSKWCFRRPSSSRDTAWA